jgi:uncharacterized protein
MNLVEQERVGLGSAEINYNPADLMKQSNALVWTCCIMTSGDSVISLDVPTVDVRTRIPEEVIRELARRIVERFQPKRVILFGSYAHGAPRPESDVDLLVIMDTPLREPQQAMLIRQYLNPLFGLDLIVYTPANFARRLALGDSFLREILEQGQVLYESPDA